MFVADITCKALVPRIYNYDRSVRKKNRKIGKRREQLISQEQKHDGKQMCGQCQAHGNQGYVN